MQNRYAGDVGDFGKLALLRALAPELRLGVCWYRVADEAHNNDGKHRDYLVRRKQFRELDPTVFDALEPLRAAPDRRSVAHLEELGLLPDATFHSALVPRKGPERSAWFESMRGEVADCDLVFLDPDNGFAPKTARHKHVLDAEITSLLEAGRALAVYHHQTRHQGGARAEVAHLTERLFGLGASRVQAIRFRLYSSRYYFLLNASDAIHQRLQAFAARWGRRVELFGEVRRP